MAIVVNPQIAGGLSQVGRDFFVDTSTSTGTTSVAEQILKQVAIPAGLITSARYFCIRALWSKSGTTDNVTPVRIRLGTAGTVADASIASSNSFLAANRSYVTESWFTATDATTLRLMTGNFASSFHTTVGTTAIPINAAIPDMSANNLILTLSATMAGTTDTPSVNNLIIVVG